MKPWLHTFCSRLAFLAVYTAFLAVQLMGLSQNNDNWLRPLQHTAFTKSGSSLRQAQILAGKHSAKPSNIRLNKRFQPEAILAVPYAPLPDPAVYATTPISPKPNTHLLVSSILAASLRGPPVIG